MGWKGTLRTFLGPILSFRIVSGELVSLGPVTMGTSFRMPGTQPTSLTVKPGKMRREFSLMPQGPLGSAESLLRLQPLHPFQPECCFICSYLGSEMPWEEGCLLQNVFF